MASCSSVHPVISVIVPVYNVEPYLRACLDSIRMQSFTDWEMLLIDDGSTDNSGVICDEYAAMDDRILVFHQENRGLSAARNAGLDHVRGQYIAMIDSDDVMLSEDYLNILLRSIEEYGARIAVADLYPFSDNPPSRALEYPLSIKCYNGPDAYANHMGKAGFNYGHVGAKLYDRSLFSSVRYPIGKLAEDNAIAHLLFSPCERVAVIDAYIYGYRMRPGSIMSSSDKSVLIHDTVAAFNGRVEYFKQLGRPDLSHLAEQELLKTLNKIRKMGART